jgi:hypothetical protein
MFVDKEDKFLIMTGMENHGKHNVFLWVTVPCSMVMSIYVTILPPLISFFITCPVTSSLSPHLVLTIYCLLHILHPFTKPRTVLLSIYLFLFTFLTNLPCLLTKHLTLLPIPYQTASHSYQFLVARILGCTILRP